MALLLLTALAGLVIHRIRPQWLRSIEVDGARAAQAAAPPAAAPTTTRPRAAAPKKAAEVAQSQTGFDTATMTVRASSYQVVVTAQAPCWVQVSTPATFTPQFGGVLTAGMSKTFSPGSGQMTVLLGASHVQVQVEVGGRLVPGWQFTPSGAPFTLNFTSLSS